nr:13958_t:CDS:2 [Entrophospora candida]
MLGVDKSKLPVDYYWNTKAWMRQANWPQLEEALALWFDQDIKHNLTISGDILKTKAQALAKLININDFKGSDRWLSHFKHQHHIYSVTNQGESASAPLELLPQYRKELQGILKDYDPNDIYNCDETVLFWQLEPSKTLAHGETSDGEDSIELELQNIINEYYRESQPVEDYINHESKYEAEGMPSLEEVVADALQSCENLLIYIQQEQGFVVDGYMLDSLQELKKKLISQKF